MKPQGNEHWGAALRAAHAEVTGDPRGIRLPSSGILRIEGPRSSVTMTVLSKSVDSNLQTNGAAVEAWALALRVWCDVEEVVLDWEAPADLRGAGHYQRFLYRAAKFASLFPWIRLARPEALSKAEAIHGDRLTLNVSLKAGRAKAANAEARLERCLRHSPAFRDHFGLSKLGTQFPVGLFRTKVARGNEVFTGGASAIDILGMNESKSLWVFELKAGGNIPAGIVSELLLYVWMMQDVIRGRFTFPDERLADQDGLQPNDVQSCKQIEARFVGHHFHPLLDRGRIVAALNHAMDGSDVPVRFGAVRISGGGDESGFEFRET